MLVWLAICSTPEAQTLVYLEQADNLLFDQELVPDGRIVRGNVIFRHEDAVMYCDSAIFYDGTNSLDAYGHVRLEQGDTLTGYGDKLFYDGNSKLARFRQHVRLIHTTNDAKSAGAQMTLTTDSLNYDRHNDIAYYFSGGTIVDDLNTLKSYWGQYTPYNKQATFRDSVRLLNPRFTMETDTLLYNTDTHIASLVSATTILYEQETTILSHNGLYNTQTEESQLFDRSEVIHSDGMTLTGDTIFYDKHQSYGLLFGNIVMTDSTNQLTLTGQYGELYEQTSPRSKHTEWGSHGFVTREALLEQWGDSLHTYMHADTLFTEELAMSDTLPKDSTYRRIRAYEHARVYREDLQAVCDSAVFIGVDSIVKLFGTPVCWNENNQVSADSMLIYFVNEELDRMHGLGTVIVIQQYDLIHYNQMAGKEMMAYIKDGDISEVHVSGNAETVFFPQDESDNTLTGCNRTQSSFVKVYLKDRQVDHVLFTTSTTGTMYPLNQASDETMHLSTFFWAEDERPRTPADVLNHVQRSSRPQKQAISASE